MDTFLTWIELSALGRFMRESGAWTYPIVNLLHLLGVSTLFGSVVVIDLALVGVWSRSARPALAQAASRVTAGGFILATFTGIGLLASNATEYRGNPFFAIKFPAIAAGLANAILVRRSAGWRALQTRALTAAEDRQIARFGVISLVSWFVAVAAGRLIGYW
ncbi:MAG: DUF6644 family protein [Vicinamibacterales bacterium]